NRDISNFNPEQIPETTLKTNIIKSTIPLVKRFLLDLASSVTEESEYTPRAFTIESEIKRISLQVMFTEFESWVNYMRLKKTMTRTSFTRDLNKYIKSKVFYNDGKSFRGIEINTTLLN